MAKQTESSLFGRADRFFRRFDDDCLFLLLLGNVVAVGILAFWLCSKIDSDEIEHAHVTWAMNQGILPYRDIHQNHAPMLWIVAGPMLRLMPETGRTVLFLRSINTAAILGIVGIGLFVLRELRVVLGPINRYSVLSFTMLSLLFMYSTQCYRFRPDPWMAFWGGAAIWMALRMRHGPMLYALLCGVAMGIAASFSPKVAPLGALVPLLCTYELLRGRSFRALWPLFPYVVGIFVGVAPLACWLISHDLWSGCRQSCLSDNSGMMNLRAKGLVLSVVVTCRLAVIPLLGAMLLLCEKSRRISAMAPWSPLVALAIATLLAWLVIVATPSHFDYNLQVLVMPLAVWGAYFLSRVAGVFGTLRAGSFCSRSFAAWVFCAVLSSVLVSPTCGCFTTSYPAQNVISAGELQRLIDLTRAKGATCVALAPWHPVFCRDATELYLSWDFYFLDFARPGEARQVELGDRWRRAVEAIPRGPVHPVLVFGDESFIPWKRIYEKGVISKEQYEHLMDFLRTNYREVSVSSVGMPKMFVRP